MPGHAAVWPVEGDIRYGRKIVAWADQQVAGHRRR